MDRRLVDVCQAGNKEAFYALLEDEPQILDFIDEIPLTRTPLHLAIIAQKSEFSKEIANFKPSFISKLDSFGYNPIHLAAENGQVEMVRSLLEKLEFEKTEHLLRGKENRTPLHFAVISGKIEAVKFLIENYPSCIMDSTVRNETALHLAVKNKQLGVFLFLLEHLKVVYHQCHGKMGLMGAVYSSFDDSKGVAYDLLNCKDEDGNTILHLATMMNQEQVVEALLSSCTNNNSIGILQVDVNTLNGKNYTALDILLQIPEEQRNPKIEEILLRAGAKTRGTI